MGKKRGGKPLKVGRIRGELALTTLADKTVLTVTVLNAIEAGYYLISADAMFGIENLAASEGPILCGFAHGDYTVTELKENIEQKNSFSTDQIALEQSRRKVREAGMINGLAAGDPVLNDGKAVRVKLKFYLEEGQTLNAWFYNDSGAALTTGAVAKVHGKIYAKRM